MFLGEVHEVQKHGQDSSKGPYLAGENSLSGFDCGWAGARSPRCMERALLKNLSHSSLLQPRRRVCRSQGKGHSAAPAHPIPNS